MCLSPCSVPNVGLVECRYCWRCRRNRVNDLVGRCIAESHTSAQTLAVTLTYAGDHPSTATLVYSDVQKFLKSLRKSGRKVRYICAGEYGSKKGRAHWHIILFLQNNPLTIASSTKTRKPDEIVLERRISWAFWPHGVVLFQQPNYKGFAYALKYVLKDQRALVARSHLAMSKKPPLGHDFMMGLAQDYVDQGLAPQEPVYQFRQEKTGGKLRDFWLRGRMRELFLDAYRMIWSISRGGPYPYSELLLEREEEILGRNLSEKEEARRFDVHLRERDRLLTEYRAAEQARYERENAPSIEKRYIVEPTHDTLIVENQDGSCTVFTRDYGTWHEKTTDAAARTLRALQVPLPGGLPA